MIWPTRASKPDSPITVARQRILRGYQQRQPSKAKCQVICSMSWLWLHSVLLTRVTQTAVPLMSIRRCTLAVYTLDGDKCIAACRLLSTVKCQFICSVSYSATQTAVPLMSIRRCTLAVCTVEGQIYCCLSAVNADHSSMHSLLLDN